MTSLAIAARRGFLDIVKLLLQRGADMHIKDRLKVREVKNIESLDFLLFAFDGC